MRIAVLIVGCLGLSGAALWLCRAPVHSAEAQAAPSPVSPSSAAAAPGPPIGVPVVPTATPTALLGQRLDPHSPRVIQHVDSMIPSRLYAEAARCYKGGLHRDKTLDLTFHLKVSDGEVAISKVRVEESTLGDRALERCIVARVEAARWRDEVMPDWESDDEPLYISVGGFKNHIARNDDEPPADGTEPGSAGSPGSID